MSGYEQIDELFRSIESNVAKCQQLDEAEYDSADRGGNGIALVPYQPVGLACVAAAGLPGRLVQFVESIQLVQVAGKWNPDVAFRPVVIGGFKG